MDPYFARFLRIPALVIAIALMAYDLIVIGLMPASRHPDWLDYAIPLAPIALAFGLTWLAGWLRSQEASDPTNDGKVSKSILRYFLSYALISFAISCLIALIVLR